jgi:hypothetical protein
MCLEGLWGGQGIMPPLPDADVEHKVRVRNTVEYAMNLDGAMDDDRLMGPGLPLRRRSVQSVVAVTGTASPSLTATDLSVAGLSSNGFSVGESSQTTHTSCHSDATLQPGDLTPKDDTIKTHMRVAKKRSDSHQEKSSFDTVSAPPVSRYHATTTLNQPDASSLAPSTKGAIKRTQSREARSLLLGFGEAFVDGQRKLAATQEQGSKGQRASSERRSLRLSLVPGDDDVLPSRQAPKAKSDNKSPSLVKGLFEDAAKSANRLEDMYRQREATLAGLEPGQSAPIRLPRQPKGVVKYLTGLDALGVPFTTLLSEYSRSTVTTPNTPTFKTSPVEKPKPSKSSKGPSAAVESWHEKQHEHWCYCHGVDDGSEMVACSNTECLIGWFHKKCVGEENFNEGKIKSPAESLDTTDPDTDGWVCTLCALAVQTPTRKMPPSESSSAQVSAMFLAVYEHAIPQCSLKRIDTSTLGHLDEEADSEQALPQYDGPMDPPPRPSGTVSWRPIHGPQSLLTSRHAPVFEEEPEQVQTPKTPGMSSSPDSTTSEGLWVHPPTRIQHLAEFFRVGNSLGEKERAAVELWKTASKEQIAWERHMERAESLRQHYAMDVDDMFEPVMRGTAVKNTVKAGEKEETDQATETEEEDEEAKVAAWEAKTGFYKKACRGRELSSVLADVRSD